MNQFKNDNKPNQQQRQVQLIIKGYNKMSEPTKNKNPPQNKQSSIIITKHKSISAIKQINYPKTKFQSYNDNTLLLSQLKNTSHQTLSKKQLLLKLQHMKDIKQSQYQYHYHQSHLTRSNTDNLFTYRIKEVSSQVQNKRTIYSNLHKRSIERQSSAKKSIGDASQNQFLNQIKSNHHHQPNTLPIIENHFATQKKHYQTQRKKVTSLGAGFRKRTKNIQAIKLLQQKLNNHQFRITRTTSRNKLSKLKPIQMYQKTQQKPMNRNVFKQTFYKSSQRNPMVLIETSPVDFIIEKQSSSNTQVVKRINQKKPSISLSIKSKHKQKDKQKSQYKNHKHYQLFKPKRIEDIESFINERLKQRKEKLKDFNSNIKEGDQHIIISLGDDFFEMNGFGIVSSLQRFDILSTSDKQGVVFNKLFKNSIGQCPYFVNRSYMWIRVNIIGYNSQTKRVAVQQIDNQFKKQQQPNDKQSLLLQKRHKVMHVSRLSVRINEQRVKQLRKQIFNSNKRKQLTQSQYQLAYGYLTQPYWTRVTQARQRLIQFRNSQKYHRYLNKLITYNQQQQQQQPSLALLLNQLQPIIQLSLKKTISKQPEYIPSPSLNFKKRVSLLQAMMAMIRQQCILIYDRHFVVMRDMYYYPQKYNEMQLLVYKVEDYLHGVKKRRVILSKWYKRREYSQVKRVIELNHYSNVPNFILTVEFIIYSVQKLSQQFKMNISQLIRTKLTLNKLTQQNNSFFQFSNMDLQQQQQQQQSSITLQFFIQTIQDYLTYLINSLIKYRQSILQEITYHLQESFSFTYTTKTPQFIQSVNTFKKSIKDKCYKLINNIFIQIVNTYVYSKTINEFIGWMKWANSWYFFKLNVNIIEKQHHNNGQFDNYEICIYPKKQLFQQRVIDTFVKYLKEIQDIDDLQSQLSYQQYQSHSLKKILIYDNMLQTLKKQLHSFTSHSYSTIKHSLDNNISHHLHTYFNPYKFSLLPFTLQSLNSYHETLITIQKDIHNCQTYLIHEVTIFTVNLKDMKQQLLYRMRKQHKTILKKIQKQVSIQIDKQYDLFLNCRKRLSQQVNDEIQYIQCRKYMNNQCQQLLHSSIQHYQIVEQYYQLFQSHFYQYSFELYIKHTRIIKQRQLLNHMIQQKLKQLIEIQALLLQKINQQRDTLSIDIDQIKQSILKVIQFTQVQLLPKYYVQTNKCYFKLEEIKNMLSNINIRQKLLKQQPSTFKLIEQMHKQLLPYYKLHTAIHEVLTIDSQWRAKPLMQLSYSHIHNILVNNLNILQQVSKLLIQKKNSSALSFADLAINVINKNLSSLWIVQHLTKQAMLKKPNILKQALTHILQNNQYVLNQLTISDILKLNLTQQKKAFIIEKSLIAQRVYNLQKLLQQTVNNTKTFQLQFIVQKSNNNRNNIKIKTNTNNLRDQVQKPIHYVNKTRITYLISCMKQQKQSVHIIEGNEVAHMIAKKISYVLNKLNIIQSTLQHMLQFQQLLTKINDIMRNPQIINFIGQQYIHKYEQVIKLWQKMVQVFVKQPQLWEAIDSEAHKNRLRQGINGMDQILTKIQSIVDEKMGQCPKLYFVPRQILYDFLQQQPGKQLSAQVLQLLYGQGFRRFIYEENIEKQQRNIVGFQGQLGQVYLFRRPINSLKIFWTKYHQIDQQISLLMRQVLNQTINRVLSKQQNYTIRSDNSQKNYLISQLLEQNINWTQMMNRLVHSQNGSQQNNQLFQKMLDRYNSFCDMNIFNDNNNNKLTTRTQIQRKLLILENKLYLRDVFNKFMNMSVISRVQDWKLFPKYNILAPTQTNTKHHKISLSVNTHGFDSNNRNQQQQQQQLNLCFGTQLPDYSSYPLHQFMSSQTTIRQSFNKYLIARQLQLKVPLIKKSHTNVYKKLIQHSLNHFVSIELEQHLNFKEQGLLLLKQSNMFVTQQTNQSAGVIKNNSLNHCLQNITTGFLLTQSNGIIQLDTLQDNHHSIKSQIIKFYAYTLQKVMQQIDSKSFAIKIWQLDIKVNKNYKLNLALCSDTIDTKYMSQSIVESRLLQYRTREINFCQPHLNVICKKVVQSYAWMIGLEQHKIEQLRQIVQKLLLIVKQQSKLVSTFIIRFFKQLTHELVESQISMQRNTNTQHVQFDNNNLHLLSKQDSRIKKFIYSLLTKVKQQISISQQVYQQLVEFIINKLGKKEYHNLLLQKQNKQDPYQQVYDIIYQHLLKVQYNQIRQFSFQKWGELIIRNNDQNIYQKQQFHVIDKQQFVQMKNKFIQKIHTLFKVQVNQQQELLNVNKCSSQFQQQQQIKTKIVISGQSMLSHKTSTILKLLQQIKIFSLGQFIQQLQSISRKDQTLLTNQQQQQQQTTNSLQNNTLCNYSNKTITPTIQCINSNISTKCQHKWHIVDSTYYHSINSSLFYTYQNKIIFQTTTINNNDYSIVVNMVNPSIIHNVLFIHLPTQNISREQRISYELNKLSPLNINKKSIIINEAINMMKVLFSTHNHNHQQFNKIPSNKLSELNFILVIKNYAKLIEIFSTQIQPNNHKITEIKEFLLMLLYWAIYPIIYQIDFFTMLKPQHFGSQFPQPLKQLQNWHYSLTKKTWIQWVTLSDFIDQHQLNTTIVDNRNIFIPVNQSLSFMYLLKKVSSFQNCLVLSEQNSMRRSFLTNLILSNKTDTIKCYMYRPSSIRKVHHLLLKQVSKLTVTGEYIPTKNRKLKFIIQDINLNLHDNHQTSSQLNQYNKKYLLNLIHKNYDSKRKSFLKNVNFVVSLSDYCQQNNHQQKHLQTANLHHLIMKQSVVIKLKEYSDESLRFIYKSYLQQFFGNTENPYSKEVRQMTNIIIYLSISIKNNMKSFRYGNKLTQKLQSVYLSLKRSTPKVIKSHEDILKLFNYEMKRQFNDLFVGGYYYNNQDINNNVDQDNFIFPSCYNKVLNQMIEKLFFTQQLQKHRTQLGLQQFDLQKIQNLRNFLSTQKTSFMMIDKHNNNILHNKFTNQQDIFTRINIPQNTTQYKQLYKCYDKGIQKLSQMIQKNLLLLYQSKRSQQHQQPKYELSLFLSKQLVSDVTKLMRVYTLENNHALILSNGINQIKTLTIMATKLYFNHAIVLNIIQLHHNISFKGQLIKLLKCKFKQHLKLDINNKSIYQYQQSKIPILIIIPQMVSQTIYKDLQLLNEYLQTGEFLSLLISNQNDKHKSNNSLLMSQLRIKSLQSQKYLKFKSFCLSKIHFIFGFKKSNQQNSYLFKTFPTLTKRISVNLQLSSISDQSKIQLAIKSTMSILPNKLAQQSSYLLPFRLFKIYEQFIEKQKYTNLDMHSININNNYQNSLYSRFCQLLNRNLKQTLTKIQQNITIRKQTINNINEIFQFKKYLERKSQRLKNKQIQMKSQHHQKQLIKNQLQIVRNQKHQIFRTQQHIYTTQLNNCKKLKLIVDEQTSKVGPILQKAQLVLQKVTRDDINQLRSFPNPPLPASKVCQSLIFLFDQVHLIKQKVLEGGQKIKDFWQYAKKFILNDKLVKRISDINQDTIKNIQSQVIQTVRQITSKPQLSQERVFKASSAAGNLSLFIRAVISTYDAIQMIQPKKKQLFDAQLIGQQLNKEMLLKKDDYQNADEKVNKQNQLIQKSLQQLSKLNDQISTITQQIQNIQSLINHLNHYKQVWTNQIMMLQTQQSLKMFYYSIWAAFQQVCLIFWTQQQIKQFVAQLVKQFHQSSQQSEKMQSGFEEFLKQIVLKDEQVLVDIKIQVDSIINIRQFQHLTTLINNLAHFQIPYSQNQGYLNRISSIFYSLKTFNKEDVKSYWIVDETLTLKRLFSNVKEFNNSQLSQLFNFKVVQMIDCLDYKKFDEYLIKTKRVIQNKNIYQFQQYPDEQSDNQEEEDQLIQKLKQQQQNISMKSVVIIKNFEHSTLNIQQDLSRMIGLFTQQDKIVIFLTDYSNHSLQRQLEQIDIRVKIDLSQTVFINLLINKMNFIKLQNTTYYKTFNEIKRIKWHQLIVLNKLRTQKSNNNRDNSSPIKSIQQMLQDNEQVIKLCQDFKQMDVDKLIIKQIKSKRLANNNKILKTDEQLKQWLKNIYIRIKLNSIQHKENVGIQNRGNHYNNQQSNRQPISSTIIMRQLNPIGYWQFNLLVDEYLMYGVFEQMRINTQGLSQEQIDVLIDKYLNTIQSHAQMSEISKFKLYIQKMEWSKYSKIDNSILNQMVRFGSIINCIVLDHKRLSSSSTNIIQTLKLTYQDKLFILQPSHLYHQQQHYSTDLSNTINSHYNNQSQIVILVDNLFNLNKILTLLRQQIHKLIYKKCVQEKDMEQNDLLAYLHQQQEFRIIVLIEQQQQQQRQSMHVDKQKQCKLINPQMIDTHQHNFSLPNILANRLTQQQLSQTNQHMTKSSIITIKNFLQHLQTTDRHSVIIKQHLQTKFYEF